MNEVSKPEFDIRTPVKDILLEEKDGSVPREGKIMSEHTVIQPSTGSLSSDPHSAGLWQAAVLKYMMEGTCLVDAQGFIVYTNPAFDAMFGCEWGEMIGADFTAPAGNRRNAGKLAAPDLLEKLSEYGSWHGERINRKKDGTPFVTFAHVTRAEIERQTFWLCVHYDNARLGSQAHDAAAEQRRRARAAALVADVAVALCEIADLPAMLNRVAEALVEHLDAAFARVWTLNDGHKMLHLQASAGMYTHLDGSHSRVPVGAFKIGRIAQDRQPHITNEVIGDPEVGDQQWAKSESMVAFAGYPLVVTGKVVGVMALFSRHPLADDTLFALDAVADIVAQGIERKRLEETLRLRADELAEADRKKDIFLAMLSHELRNPLSAIRNAVQVLDKISDTGETPTRLRSVVTRQVNHLSRIVEDLLDVSRLTGGIVELRKESISLHSIIDDAVESSAAAMERKGHTLSISLPAEDVRLSADPTRLQQVISNLLDNSAKYSDSGSSIWLGAELDASDSAYNVVITIKDNGIGMAPDLLPHVFDLFTQADHSLERSQGGLGIGLTVVRQLVELHGGTIQARSEGPGRGSEFVVKLPAEHPPLVPSQGAAIVPKTVGS